MNFWHYHVYGVPFQKVYAYIHTQTASFTPFLNHISMMLLVGIHQRVRLRAEKGALLAVILTTLFVDYLCHIIHALPPNL